MKYLVTGAAGFIGNAVCKRLLDDGHGVLGIDNLSPYYAVALKRKRLARLHAYPQFEFQQVELSEPDALLSVPGAKSFDRVIHLAAQAGVRHSMKEPFPFVSSNVVGHLAVLEFCRRMPQQPLLIYASSSSVYGQGATSPFREDGAKGAPASLYAVTKETDELMSQAYALLYGLPQIGLRFFTVYGPWGRPDMAYWLFTRQALLGEPLQLFNHGEMSRDFSYIDDVVNNLIRVATGKPQLPAEVAPHAIFNIGSGKSLPLRALVDAVGAAVGSEVTTKNLPMQAGDMQSTCADMTSFRAAYGEISTTTLADGVQAFVDWFRGDPELMEY